MMKNNTCEFTASEFTPEENIINVTQISQDSGVVPRPSVRCHGEYPREGLHTPLAVIVVVIVKSVLVLIVIFFNVQYTQFSGPKAGMALVGHADANRHVLLNTRKRPVYSTCRLCQQTQTLNLLVVVQVQCAMGCAADESGMEDEFSAP
jgi:hypothetical protein